MGHKQANFFLVVSELKAAVSFVRKYWTQKPELSDLIIIGVGATARYGIATETPCTNIFKHRATIQIPRNCQLNSRSQLTATRG